MQTSFSTVSKFFVDGPTLQAGSASFIGQLCLGADNTFSISTALGAGGTHGTVNCLNDFVYFQSGRFNTTLDVLTTLTCGVGIANNAHAIVALNNNTSAIEQIVCYTNNVNGVSAFSVLDRANLSGITLAAGEATSGGTYASEYVLEPFYIPGNNTGACAPFTIRTFGTYGGLAGPRYRLRFESNGDCAFYKHANASTLGTAGVALLISKDGYMKQTPRTVANLIAAATAGAGARDWVSDANATLTAGIGAVVVGGGANSVPVCCDGTNWRIG